LTEHAVVVERARTAVAELERRLEAAQQSGALRTFNVRYKEHRLDAQRRGEIFMPYVRARRRLVQALASVAAGALITDLIDTVLDNRD
jgi:hypothetical protein